MTSERQAALEDARFAALFEQSPTFMAVLRGPEHRFELANPACRRLMADRDVVGRTVAEALPEAVEQGFSALLDAVYANGTPHQVFGAPFRIAPAPGAEPHVRHVDMVYQPIRDAAGAVNGIFVNGVDVTERHQAQAQVLESESRRSAEQQAQLHGLRESARRKDAFVATLAHELRNPLAPIAGAAELLLGPPLAPERVRWCGEVVRRHAEQMSLLLEDLLDVSRVETGKLTLRKGRVVLRDVLEQAVQTARRLLDERRHRLEVRLPAADAVLEADPLRVAQIVSNLLVNAAKFTPEGGRIVLVGRLDAGAGTPEGTGTAVIEVRDDGIGIRPEMLDGIFGLYRQGPDPTVAAAGGNDQPTGLGIGLALARSLAELHGGRIVAESGGPGQGATFRVTLPRGRPGDPAAAPAPPSAARGSGRRLLVVDDNADAAETLALVLGLHGFAVDVAHSGGEALARARAGGYDALLVDVGMPGMSGHEVAMAVRREAWGRGLLLVATTGWGHEHDQRQAFDAGFDLHFTKPVNPDAVTAAIGARLGP